MAKVQVQVAGGSIQEKNASCVEDLRREVNATGYIATVNGEPQDGSYRLKEFEFVSFAKAVKAGRK